MIYKLNGKKFDDNNFDFFQKELKAIEVSSLSQDGLKELIDIFESTTNPKVEHVVSLIFADLNDENILPVLIRKIEKIKHSNYTDTIIYACSEYDCYAYVNFFVGLVIELDGSACMQSISVLEEIKKPIKLSDKVLCTKRLSDYLSVLSKEDEKYEDITYAIELIEGMQVVFNTID